MSVVTMPQPEPDDSDRDENQGTGPGTSGRGPVTDPILDAAQVFINDGRRTVVASLTDWLCSAAGRRPGHIHLVTGFLSLRGLLHVTDLLADLSASGHQVRLLLGVSVEESAHIWRRAHIQGTHGAGTASDLSNSASGTAAGTSGALPAEADPAEVAALCGKADQALCAELNGVPLTGMQLRRLQQLADLLSAGRVECRRYQRGFLHSKMVVVDRHERVHAAVGSSNLTLGGLSRNREFNAVVGRAEARAALHTARAWWDDAHPYDLAALIAELFTCHPAELVHLRMLWEAYGAEVNADPSTCMALADYQRDGVARVTSILARYGGVLIADEVGLGKTYIAGEVARLAVTGGRGPVIVVAPASLRKMWRRRLAEWGLNGVQVLSYGRLVNLYRKVVEDGHLWQRCGMLILDEAHAVRNPLTARMEAVRSLLAAQEGAGAQVIVMSATPVNNDAGDQFELLALADRDLEPDWNRGRTFHKVREAARSSDGRRLAGVLVNPLAAAGRDRAWYYQMVHARMLRRDRPFIRRAYPTPTGAAGQRADTVGGSAQRTGILFPSVDQVRVDVALNTEMYELFAAVLDAVGHADNVPGGLPAELAGALQTVRAPGGQPCTLTLAAYRRDAYRLEPPEQRSGPLRGLLRAMLCKRLESSPAALAATAQHMALVIEQVLAELDAGIVRPTRCKEPGRWGRLAAMWDVGDDDKADEVLEELAGACGDSEPASLYDTSAMRTDLTHDLALLHQLAARARAAIPGDPKKAAFTQLLLQALADPRGRKIVVFASARETTHDLGAWLEELIASDDRFAALHGRLANLGCRPEPKARAAEAALSGFAPETASNAVTEATLPPAADRYDVLICTDKFSEGVNLQQAALCVNYDLTWNPQRLGQRVGRLDRVGSRHERVTCWTMLPATVIGAVLQIMDILTWKAEIAAETVGVPTPLFPGSPCQSYTSLLDTWNVSPEGAPRTGVGALPEAVRDHGWATAWLGNALRTKAAAAAITGLQHGAGSVRPAPEEDSSVVFCFRVHTPDGPHQGKGNGHTAAFAQVYAESRRAGHISLDTDRCLRHTRIDPSAWIEKAAGDGTTAAGPGDRLERHDLDLIATLLDQARAAVADEQGVPQCTAEDRVQLICWMLLKSASGTSGRRW